jgi:hypothetical protein
MATSKRSSNEQTSTRVASQASAALRNPSSTAQQKSIAGTALTQARNHPTGKKK